MNDADKTWTDDEIETLRRELDAELPPAPWWLTYPGIPEGAD